MKDLAIELAHRLGALAELGEALGDAGVSIEGGGVSVAGGVGLAHFLVSAATAARAALERPGLRVIGEHEVVMLRQRDPRQLHQLRQRLSVAARFGEGVRTPLQGLRSLCRDAFVDWPYKPTDGD